MEAFAHVKYVRMSPRKVKLVCDMIRGKDVKTAAAYLSQTSKAACEPMAQLLKRAVATPQQKNQTKKRARCFRLRAAVSNLRRISNDFCGKTDVSDRLFFKK